jgi:G3E family GTPase
MTTGKRGHRFKCKKLAFLQVAVSVLEMSKPLLFLTGFLGAGKTTLLRGILTESRMLGRSCDVILNDFENAEIDAATLPSYAASIAPIAPIAASCACCDSLEDLVQLALAAQASRGDALLVELNGTADPLPLLESFTLLEEKLPFFPRWQVAVIHARNWGRRGEYAALERRQLETATHWVLTHAESLTARELRAIARGVASVNPHAKRSHAHGLAADLHIARGGPEAVSYLSGGGHRHDHTHALSHRFTGCQVPLPGRYRSEDLIALLESLPPVVVRAKALVRLQDRPRSRWLFGRSIDDPVGEPYEVDGLAKAPSSLVCIGPGLDPAAIRALVEEQLKESLLRDAAP